MALWVPITIAAAFVQAVRFSLQKRLKGAGLSTGGATMSRFLFAAPLAMLATLGVMVATGSGLPRLGGDFWPFAIAGGLAQIVATFCTVALFSERNFAVGIAFTKTETVQVALVSGVVLGDHVSATGFIAILIGLAGVLILSRPPRRADGGRGSVVNRASGLGLLAGALFAVAALGYRGATLAVESPDPLLRAALSLACVTVFQSLAMGAWLAWREPGELARMVRGWRRTAPVGVLGMLGSLGWFTAFTLQNAAYVRSLGQVELVFVLLISALAFREKITRSELAGIALLMVGIVMIVAQS